MHDNFIESFSEYLDGELEADRKDGLEKHLKECAECSATLADLRRVVMQARSLPMRAPSEKVWSAIASEVALATDESSPAARVSRRVPSRILAAAALLIALLLGAGGSAWWIAHQAQSNRSGTRWLLLLHETASVPDGQVKGASMEQIIARYLLAALVGLVAAAPVFVDVRVRHSGSVTFMIASAVAGLLLAGGVLWSPLGSPARTDLSVVRSGIRRSSPLPIDR